jgi:hypothetical protein
MPHDFLDGLVRSSRRGLQRPRPPETAPTPTGGQNAPQQAAQPVYDWPGKRDLAVETFRAYAARARRGDDDETSATVR